MTRKEQQRRERYQQRLSSLIADYERGEPDWLTFQDAKSDLRHEFNVSREDAAALELQLTARQGVLIAVIAVLLAAILL